MALVIFQLINLNQNIVVGGAVGYDRDGEAEDSGQGGPPAGSAAPDLRRQAARGRPHVGGLQHPEGQYAALGTPPPWWRLITTSRNVCDGKNY